MAGRMALLGTKTAFEVLARANALAAEGRSIINLGIGQPISRPPIISSRPAGRRSRRSFTAILPPTAFPALRAAVAADLWRRHRVEVSPDSAGRAGRQGDDVLRDHDVRRAGAEILYPNPAYRSMRALIRFSGATPVPVPLLRERRVSFSAEEVLKRSRQDPAPDHHSPANPTGGVRRPSSIGSSPGSSAIRARRGDERRDLRRILYDGASMSASWAIRSSATPDPARRLEQDLCDAGWRKGDGVCAKAVFADAERSRSTAIPASTRRRNMPGSPRSKARASLSTRMVKAFAERRE